MHNVLSNVASPVALANDILQAKPRRAGDTLMRFLVNSTVGVAGIFDVATGWGYPSHDADSGMTLAIWGLPDGPVPVPAGARADRARATPPDSGPTSWSIPSSGRAAARW